MRTDEQYRHECEVRTVARWPVHQISAYLQDVQKHRGRPAAEKLHSDVQKARQALRGNTATSGSRSTDRRSTANANGRGTAS